MPRIRFVQRTTAQVPTTPFVDAEEAWFWFVRCQRARDEGVRFADRPAMLARPCDPDDIYLAAVGLARQGRIGSRHLKVLATFGLCGRPPDPRCRDEQQPARLWDEALDSLTTVLKAKGIVA